MEQLKEEIIFVFEPGDIVLFQDFQDRFKNNIGMILRHKENGNYVILGNYNSVYRDIHPLWITDINNVESVRNEITTYYEEKITILQNQIRKPTQEEKEIEKIEKYNQLKKQILETAKNMISSKDDCDFESKLKAISSLKHEIFSIKLECVLNIRKENGRIKGKIRGEENIRDISLKKISDEKIKKFLADFK